MNKMLVAALASMSLAAHAQAVWILWSWQYESQFEVTVPLATVHEHAQRLLEAAAWVESEKAKEGSSRE